MHMWLKPNQYGVMLVFTYAKFPDHRAEVHLGNFEMRLKSQRRSKPPASNVLEKVKLRRRGGKKSLLNTSPTSNLSLRRFLSSVNRFTGEIIHRLFLRF